MTPATRATRSCRSTRRWCPAATWAGASRPSSAPGSGWRWARGWRSPDWLSVNIMGDAAFGMVGMDFETAVRARLPILTIVMNNGLMGGYGEWMPDAVERHAANRLGGDYAAIGAALGGHTERVERPGELRPALERCIAATASGRAALLEVMTHEEHELATRTERSAPRRSRPSRSPARGRGGRASPPAPPAGSWAAMASRIRRCILTTSRRSGGRATGCAAAPRPASARSSRAAPGTARCGWRSRPRGGTRGRSGRWPRDPSTRSRTGRWCRRSRQCPRSVARSAASPAAATSSTRRTSSTLRVVHHAAAARSGASTR